MAGTATRTLKMKGDKSYPEKPYYIIEFPGGTVHVARTTDNEYWAHITINHPNSSSLNPDEPTGRMSDCRIDVTDKHASEVTWQDFENPNLYHVAVKITTKV